MLPAFVSDQILQRCSKVFQKVWKALGTKSELWFSLKAAFLFKDYESFNDVYWDIGLQFKVSWQ